MNEEPLSRLIWRSRKPALEWLNRYIGLRKHVISLRKETAAEEARLRDERKRKGKEMAQPTKKKSRPAHTAVVSREPIPQPTRQLVDEEEHEEETPKGRKRRTIAHQQSQIEKVAYFFHFVTVKVDNDLLQLMVQFVDPKMEDSCADRVTVKKGLKSGKSLHLESLQQLQLDAEFTKYITGIGFEWLLDAPTTRVPEELAKEFFTSFRLKTIEDPEEECIGFRMFNRLHNMSLTEWSVRLGLFSAADALEGAWFGRHIGLATSHPQFDPTTAWESIATPDAPAYKASTSLGPYIADPALRLAQVFLGYNLLGQVNTSASLTQAELFFMWCMKDQLKVHLGFWLAYACHCIARNPTRHLNICHILGAYVKANFKMMIMRGCELKWSPPPELFNIQFLGRVRILTQKGGFLRLYTEERVRQPQPQAAIQERRQPSGRVQKQRTEQPERARTEERRRVRRPDEQLAMTVRSIDEGSSAQPGQVWRQHVVQLLTEITQNTAAQQAAMEAQAASIARAVEVMEEMLASIRPPNPVAQEGSNPLPPILISYYVL